MIDTAVILAAGEGKRMVPLSRKIPKEMLPVLDRPFMNYNLDYLEEAGIRNVAIVTSPKKEFIKRFYGRRYRSLRLFYFVQKEQLGPAHAILSAENLLKNKEFFLVQYGDSLTEINLPRETISRFRREKSKIDAFLSLRPVEDPSRYGVVKFDIRGKIVDIVEKPKAEEAPSKIATVGTFILRTETYFNSIKGADFSKGEQFPAHYVLKNGTAKGWVFYGERVDLGFPKDLIQASKLIVNSHGGILIKEGARIDMSVKIRPPVYIGDGCTIERNCIIGPNAFIGRNTFVGENSEIQESYLMKNCRVGKGCSINNSVIGENCRISDFSKVRDEVLTRWEL
ncbi:MAG: NDP-sugar synthase [Candidatus Aenigmatarchaeota archaeon]